MAIPMRWWLSDKVVVLGHAGNDRFRQVGSHGKLFLPWALGRDKNPRHLMHAVATTAATTAGRLLLTGKQKVQLSEFCAYRQTRASECN